VNESIAFHSTAIVLLRAKLFLLPDEVENAERRGVIDNLVNTRAHIFRAAKMNCDWSAWTTFDSLLFAVVNEELNFGLQSALLPFDTLGLPVEPQFRKLVAEQHAYPFNDFSSRVAPPKPSVAESKKLKIGYICYDFNDHPTAHLAEGLFLYHNKSGRVNVDAYNYGKDDNSTYRRNIEALVGGKEVDGGRFIELSGVGHDSAAAKIRQEEPHVLIDMQGFTLGGRPEITARKIAPIQVNYLIFPGTSGASFMNYVVGDKWVTPPEHESHYTEKLALLPKSYQINYYDRHLPHDSEGLFAGVRGDEEWQRLREQEGLPADKNVFVFANFNKQDKLEPEIFSVWMQILARTPNSVLWLLEPSHKYVGSGVVENLRLEAEARGVSRDRIVFASRVSKALHLRRVAAADLFLDSFMYGAHSTATDALRGGLPVLTVGGSSFARRVGVSLMENLGFGLSEHLLLSTMREFENIAVHMAASEEGRRELEEIRVTLRATWTGPLFDTEGYTRDFERMSASMWEVRQSCLEDAGCEESGQFMHVML
jgi:predicted O-linked N-acetylglucosamine transferase (SPINDLY family)